MGIEPLHSLLDQIWGKAQRSFPQEHSVFLTFDDGPDPKTTPLVLDLLEAEQIKATFFLIAESARSHPELTQRICASGHAIGNHSTDHRYGNYFQSVAETKKWILEGKHQIETCAKKKTIGFRPPAGVRTPVIHRALKELGMPMIYWSKRYYDTRFAFDEKKAEQKASWVKPGEIILFHDRQSDENRMDFIKGLRMFIRCLKTREISFGVIPSRAGTVRGSG